MDSNTSIRIGIRTFYCKHIQEDDLGMEIAWGDNAEVAIETAFANEASCEILDFATKEELVDFLAYDRDVGMARAKTSTHTVEFHNWFDSDERFSDYSSSLHTRVTVEDPHLADFLMEAFVKSRYNSRADALDYLETERDRYSPEL